MPWDFPSAIVGIIVGAVIVLFIMWILYITRTFIFSTIPSQQPVCRLQDYIENPGVAIANGSTLSDILFVAPADLPGTSTMLYKRVPSVNTCTPSSLNQTVIVPYPEFCEFTTADSHTYVGRNLSFGSPSYTFLNNAQQEVSVLVNGNGRCTPISSMGDTVTTGLPTLIWDRVA
jgi:hypothetical protein